MSLTNILNIFLFAIGWPFVGLPIFLFALIVSFKAFVGVQIPFDRVFYWAFTTLLSICPIWLLVFVGLGFQLESVTSASWIVAFFLGAPLGFGWLLGWLIGALALVLKKI